MYKRKNKFGAIKTIIDGIKFDSKAEAEYYTILKHQYNQNIITKLELQPKIYLTDAKILYKSDFEIEKNGRTYYVDVKGVETPVFKLKKRLFKHYGKYTLLVVKKSGRVFKVVDEVESEVL